MNIIKKVEQSSQSLVALQNKAASLALQSGTNSKVWGSYANSLAYTEGVAYAWARLQRMVDYKERTLTTDHKLPFEISQIDVNAVALDLLTSGADDTWSGRQNDLARAYFDGIRSACEEMKYL